MSEENCVRKVLQAPHNQRIRWNYHLFVQVYPEFELFFSTRSLPLHFRRLSLKWFLLFRSLTGRYQLTRLSVPWSQQWSETVCRSYWHGLWQILPTEVRSAFAPTWKVVSTCCWPTVESQETHSTHCQQLQPRAASKDPTRHLCQHSIQQHRALGE